MRPRGQTPRMRAANPDGSCSTRRASMRPRGQTPRMPRSTVERPKSRFNEAAGADPADARRQPGYAQLVEARFNEAAGADPADARVRVTVKSPSMTGADPADAHVRDRSQAASMRPRGQTPRMLTCGRLPRPRGRDAMEGVVAAASMRPRGQTPRMLRRAVSAVFRGPPDRGFNEAAGADPADATLVGATATGSDADPRMPARVAGIQPSNAVPASMRPRGQTPRMPLQRSAYTVGHSATGRFNEAAGADPADARRQPSITERGGFTGFNEAAGADPADALPPAHGTIEASNEAAGADPAMPGARRAVRSGFNEAAGADPADASGELLA